MREWMCILISILATVLREEVSVDSPETGVTCSCEIPVVPGGNQILSSERTKGAKSSLNYWGIVQAEVYIIILCIIRPQGYRALVAVS